MPTLRRPAPTIQFTPPDPQELSLSRFWRHLFRGSRRQCPNCGKGGLFRRWLIMRETCPRCHLQFDRGEPDYFIGSFTVNFITAELLICAGALAGIVLTWPDVPWEALKWGLMAAIIPIPALFYPFAKTIWLAVDLTFRPPTPADFAGHGENLSADEDVPPEALPSFPPGIGPD
jgi:uncharacterized protein (DUF983 family)